MHGRARQSETIQGLDMTPEEMHNLVIEKGFKKTEKGMKKRNMFHTIDYDHGTIYYNLKRRKQSKKMKSIHIHVVNANFIGQPVVIPGKKKILYFFLCSCFD